MTIPGDDLAPINTLVVIGHVGHWQIGVPQLLNRLQRRLGNEDLVLGTMDQQHRNILQSLQVLRGAQILTLNIGKSLLLGPTHDEGLERLHINGSKDLLEVVVHVLGELVVFPEESETERGSVADGVVAVLLDGHGHEPQGVVDGPVEEGDLLGRVEAMGVLLFLQRRRGGVGNTIKLVLAKDLLKERDQLQRLFDAIGGRVDGAVSDLGRDDSSNTVNVAVQETSPEGEGSDTVGNDLDVLDSGLLEDDFDGGGVVVGSTIDVGLTTVVLNENRAAPVGQPDVVVVGEEVVAQVVGDQLCREDL